MMWGHGSSAAWLWLGIGLLAIAGAAAFALALAGRRGPGRAGAGLAARELDERFARGDIGDDELARRRAVLNAGLPARPAGRWHRNTADRSSVPAGTVSLRVRNAGSLVHELVVLPLPAAGAGTRPVGADGTVSERGSAGEASATCAAGAGEGITPGADGWVTLHLAPGRYELICNLPGHYAMGMLTELDVR